MVDGDVTLLPGLRLRHTPGHTPGHQVALLRTADETLALTGDLLLHAAQLVDPAVTYLFDGDPDAARASRIALLDELRGGTAVLATSHPTEPFHPVPAPLAGGPWRARPRGVTVVGMTPPADGVRLVELLGALSYAPIWGSASRCRTACGRRSSPAAGRSDRGRPTATGRRRTTSAC